MKAEKERERRASIVANVGLSKQVKSPIQTTNKGVDAFRLYQEEQTLSSDDHVANFKRQMLARRGGKFNRNISNLL